MGAFSGAVMTCGACGNASNILGREAQNVCLAVATPVPPDAWQLEGDSYMIADQAWQIGLRLQPSPAPFYHAVGGSTFEEVRNRILCKPELRANPLLIWDGSANGHQNGSIELELQVLEQIAAFKGPHPNWLLILPISVPPGPGLLPNPEQISADIKRFAAEASARYGAEHVFDPLPTLQAMADGSARDREAIEAGFPPVSVLADGLHLTQAAKERMADVLMAPDGPMARVRALAPV